MKKVLTIGSGMRDIFIQYTHIDFLHLHTEQKKDAYVIMQEGRKIEVETLAYHVGGGAANSAVSFSRLSFLTSSFFKLGKDQEADFIINKLESENVNTKFIVQTEKARTGSSFIIPSSSANRTVLVYRGANTTITKSDIPNDAITTSDQIYISSLSEQTTNLLVTITKIAKKYNKNVAVNPGTSQLINGAKFLKQALKNIDTLILNSFEAQLLMASIITTLPQQERTYIFEKKTNIPELLQKPLGLTTTCFTLNQFFKEIFSHGTSTIVVTNGKEGVYAAQKDTVYFHPSLDTNIVSTLGAGDAFGSTFTASLLEKKSIEIALISGIINSTSVIQHPDTQTGLLNQEAIDKKIKQLQKSYLLTFPL